MAIPDFDHNHVLPPFVGSPVVPGEGSPYDCTSLEFCRKFAFSRRRIEILKRFLDFRSQMNAHGITSGFQWVDGSFVENIEQSQGRDPNDIDIVSFVDLTGFNLNLIASNFPEFGDPSLSKANYLVDHYVVDYCYRPDLTVESTRYWIQLFSHNRAGHWKGILCIPIGSTNEDSAALAYVNSL